MKVALVNPGEQKVNKVNKINDLTPGPCSSDT